MKILIAVHHFPPRFTGGAELRADRTAHGLQRAGHEVQAVSVQSVTHGGGRALEHDKTIHNGITVHRLYFNLARSPDSLLYTYRNPLIGRYVSTLLEDFRPDVVHLISGYLMSGSTIDEAKAASVPIVLTLTDFWFLCPRITLLRSDDSLCTTPADPLACTLCLRKEKRRYRIPDQFSRGLIGRALCQIWDKRDDSLLRAMRDRKDYLLDLLNSIDVVISPSRFLKNLFQAQGINTHRFLHIRQGLDTSKWLDAKPDRKNSQLRVGYVGQVAKHKGVDVLLEAFLNLRSTEKEAQLIIYGDTDQFPSYVKRLRKKAKGRPNIIFAGRFKNSIIRKVLTDIDILVVPSVWYENSPNVILEASATSTPVVVSKLGGMAELVEDGVNGFQFEPGKAKSLAEVLQRFIDRPDLLKNLRPHIPKVKTIHEELQELLKIYTSVQMGCE